MNKCSGNQVPPSSPRRPRLRLTVVRRTGAPPRRLHAGWEALFARAWETRERHAPAWRPGSPGWSPALPAAVTVLLVGDPEIAALNQRHMRHAGPTDVLSFPLYEHDPERRAFLLGEIVVSFETAAREAAARRLPFAEELARYAVHGFLHLLGYDDGTAAQRRAMEGMQERVLREGLKEAGS